MHYCTRRRFLQSSLIVGGATLLSRVRLASAVTSGSPNGDLRIAVVGLNGQGAGYIRTFAGMPGTKLVALCDADEAVLNQRAQEAEAGGAKPTRYRDYRRLLEDRDVDAVVIATPNHWHSLMTIWALEAGKDVYVEKPLSHNVWEGRQAVEAAKKYSNRIVMAGTQNRSSADLHEAIAYVRSGQLGKIQWARGLCYKLRESIGRTTGPQPVPASVDYDLWTGPADLLPPRRNGAKGSVHYDWHWFWNYGGGDINNQGVHQMDVARWMLGETGYPASVMSIGGRFGYQDDAETPNTLISVFNYERAPLIFEVRGLPAQAGMRAMGRYRAAQIGVILQCEGGYVHVTEGGNATIYDQADRKIRIFTDAGNISAVHREAFVKAVRDRKVTVGQIGDCHLSTSLGHLGNISYLLGKERTNPAVNEAIQASEPTREAFGRMLEHLKVNEVGGEGTRSVLGPLLTIDGAKEKVSGPDSAIAAAANQSLLMKRQGRAPFLVPDLQRTA